MCPSSALFRAEEEEEASRGMTRVKEQVVISGAAVSFGTQDG